MLASGAIDRLIGVTDFCNLPAGHPAVRLGGIANPDQEMLHALDPDLVLVNRSPGGPYAAAAIDSALPIYSISIRTVTGAIEALADLARVLGTGEAAASLLMAARQAQEQAYERQYQRRMRRVVVFTWREPWVAIGGDTYADDLLRLCGGENVALRMPGRTPRAGLDIFVRNNPEVILLASGPYPFAQGDHAAFWRYGDVVAVSRQRIRICEAQLLSHFGTRIPEAIQTISTLIHTD